MPFCEKEIVTPRASVQLHASSDRILTDDDITPPYPRSELLAFEHEGFFGTLAGSDFASTGVANSLSEEMQADPRRIALRDTVVSGYRSGLAQPLEDPHAPPGSAAAEMGLPLRRGCDALMRLALVLTVNELA